MRERILICLASAALFFILGCATEPEKAPSEIDYDDVPASYEAAIQNYFNETLKDPLSIQYREVTKPEKGYIRAPLITGGKKTYGWLVRATINAKNSYGGYTGFQTYSFIFRGERLVGSVPPNIE